MIDYPGEIGTEFEIIYTCLSGDQTGEKIEDKNLMALDFELISYCSHWQLKMLRLKKKFWSVYHQPKFDMRPVPATFEIACGLPAPSLGALSLKYLQYAAGLLQKMQMQNQIGKHCTRFKGRLKLK